MQASAAVVRSGSLWENDQGVRAEVVRQDDKAIWALVGSYGNVVAFSRTYWDFYMKEVE